MQDHTAEKRQDILKVYEIGYLLVSSIPVEKVTEVTASLKDVISKNGAQMIADEAPELRTLAYTMIKKIGPVNHRFDQGYFGWLKFEMPAGKIEEVKKSFEANPEVLRILVVTTVKENTYLGKKIPAVATAALTSEGVLAGDSVIAAVEGEEKAAIPSAPASIEEMDKSIDEMVKGA